MSAAKKNKIELWLGLSVGVLTPFFGLAAMYELYPELGRIDALSNQALKVIIIRISTFGLLLNAILFFTSIQLEKDKLASGLLYASFLYLILLGVYKFLL